MSLAVIAGRLLRIGDAVYYDEKYDLRGRITRKTDKRVGVQWEGGNAVWYPCHHMFYRRD